MTPLIPILAALAILTCPGAKAGETPFALHDGDRVVFYGDSITQEGGYGRLVEEFTRSRYPLWNVRFYNAGVGGDKVQGGWAGKADLRVARDVVSLKPTVVTIMLGMNDGQYQPLTKATLDGFTQGYRAIVDKMRSSLPGVRIYLIRSSPFDDVTRPPGFGSGYDAVLRQLGDAVASIGAEEHLEVVDFGSRLEDGLRAVWAQNPDLAKQLLPDRVHPNPAGQLTMGSCLLHAWHAPALVTRVTIDAAAAKVTDAQNTTVYSLAPSSGALTWKQKDKALPIPVNFDDSDTDLAQKAGADLESIDSEDLIVTGLKPGRYRLKIDSYDLGVFDATALAAGINLARYNSPMRAQAYQVRWGPEDGSMVERTRRQMFVAADRNETGAAQAADTLAAHDESSQAARSALAVPTEHMFKVAPASP